MKSLIIDAGHGGTDNGTSGFGVKEKDWNLKMSIYQYNRLKDLGAKVKMTRHNDTTLPPAERTAIIRNNFDLCISNHFNGFNGSARGVETIHSFYSDGKLARHLANAITKASGLPLRRVFQKKNSRGKDWYYMHRDTGRTETVIIEYGFMDNKQDFQAYSDGGTFYHTAEQVVKVLCDTLGVTYHKPVPKSKDKLYRVQAGAFAEKDNAEALRDRLVKDGYKAIIRYD